LFAVVSTSKGRAMSPPPVPSFVPRGKEGAHQIRNDTDAPVRVLTLSTLIAPDIVEYLDTGKIGARGASPASGSSSLAHGPSSNIGRTRTTSGRWLR
jgi:uncharacterized cupin superfamily protein